MKKVIRTLGLALLALSALALPEQGSAQAALAVAEAQPFLGQWSLPLESPQGMFTMTIHIEDQGGNVAARVVSDLGTQAISTYTKNGDRLVLGYTMDLGGQSAPVTLSMLPEGETMRTQMSFADGQFTLDGVATRAAGG